MRRRILILAALTAVAAGLSWVEFALGQVSPLAAAVQTTPQSPPDSGLIGSPRDLSAPHPAAPHSPPSPSESPGRPGSVSYRYDALGRIVEIVRIPAR